ncbi:MAG: DUF2892 domain-containing protein [Flavobacteriales bacterium CG_4_9_14_0_2_um_filter_35_242]|nr:DUF2892 domain-containing protein [Zetaproteobacteria bacterium]OIO12871.1 MAG: hypothetical protein AUJ53_01085 [Flavobacteriaceae bacterium CG1_02_35_72]PIR14238.1 MAG: hypothetical protein COV50_03825 [Flavobacteriales bacterium CG11_big_fil_rev_8_21_14_0_20_35_7]PIV17269.1 MAG: DUF2892 domain-containing protein [Flavobacteriales bacterium CG03_land_8_20_14_0_80_35_15]PIX06993.1 MAG: DUF2892 domain-containing protein [Flavobacteriales bacterium CG_4_8_14_3_um_filter_35_10]PJA06005.1 MAG:
MKKNVGTIDKVIRILIAAIAIYFAYKGGIEAIWAGYVLYAVGAILLFTVLTSSCPLYTITGKNTLKK